VNPFANAVSTAAFCVIKQHWAVQLATNTVMLSGPE